MKNIYIMCALLMAISVSCYAKERKEQELKKIALDQLNKKKAQTNTRKNVRATGIMPKQTLSDGKVVVYAAEGAGSVFISTDDRFRPVLGYTNAVINDETQLPCCMKWWIQEMNRQMSDKNISAGQNDKAVMERRTADVHYETISPMVSTKWGQWEPYNSYTQKFDDKNAPTGCVATALAQILNYNEWPKSASFTGGYSIDGGKNYVTANVSTTYKYPYKIAYGAYSVDGSDDNINTVSYSIVDNKYIGWLMRDCGYASNMIYGAGESGAVISDMAINVIQNFSYSEDAVKFAQRDFYSDEEWQDMIYGELAKGYPVLYSGVDTKVGGHAFVVHGIDSDGLVAVNWGWQGVCDGFYAMDAMNTGEQMFSNNQDIVYGFHPTPLSDDKFTSLWAGDYSLTDNDGSGELLLSSTGIFNYTLMDFKGYLALCFEDCDDENKIEMSEIVTPDDGVVSPFYGFTIPQTNMSNDITEILEGGHRYKVYMASCTEDEFNADVWIKARTQGGRKYYVIEVDQSGKVKITGSDFDISTSVVPVTSTNKTNKSYNISGRMVNDSYRGIVIKDGKKMIK